MAGRRGEETNVIDHRGNLLGTRDPDRLAAVLGFECDELLGPRLDGIGDTEEGERTILRSGVAPALEGRGRGLHRRVHVGGRRQRRRRILLAGGRIHHAERAAVGRVYIFAVDEIAKRLHAVNLSAEHRWAVSSPTD